MGDDADAGEARYPRRSSIACVASVYVPNGTAVGSERFAYKLGFFDRLRCHAAELLEFEEPLVIGGDLNAAPSLIDVFDAQALTAPSAITRPSGRSCAPCSTSAVRRLPDRRAAHQGIQLVGLSGPLVAGESGPQIDHLLLSPQAVDRLQTCAIDREPRAAKAPSDHAPVWCDAVRSLSLPPSNKQAAPAPAGGPEPFPR